MGTKPLVWLDLCSGLGGASQPALDRGWKVIRVDIDPRFHPDIVADVRNLPLRPFHVDVLWASTPCDQFAKWGMRCFFPDPPLPDVSREYAVRDIIDEWMPTWWIVENVWAARQWLRYIFGPVRARPPGHALWSNQLLMLPSQGAHKGSFHHPMSSGRRWGAVAHTRTSSAGTARIIEKAEAAKIPYEIGEAICRAVEARQ